MEVNILKADNKKGKLSVSDKLFDQKFNEALVHQMVTTFMAGSRAGTKAQKNRSDVSGGGAKPWKQKGTGRARAGTSRSPLWRSGGVTFAARPRDYSKKINRKMYQAGMRSIFSELARQERIIFVDDFTVKSSKTKELLSKLKDMNAENVLIVSNEVSKDLYLASRNLPHVSVIDAATIDPVTLVGAEKIIMTSAATKQLEERLG